MDPTFSTKSFLLRVHNWPYFVPLINRKTFFQLKRFVLLNEVLLRSRWQYYIVSMRSFDEGWGRVCGCGFWQRRLIMKRLSQTER